MSTPNKPGRKKSTEKIQSSVNLETFAKLSKEPNIFRKVREIVEEYYKNK